MHCASFLVLCSISLSNSVSNSVSISLYMWCVWTERTDTTMAHSIYILQLHIKCIDGVLLIERRWKEVCRNVKCTTDTSIVCAFVFGINLRYMCVNVCSVPYTQDSTVPCSVDYENKMCATLLRHTGYCYFQWISFLCCNRVYVICFAASLSNGAHTHNIHPIDWKCPVNRMRLSWNRN